MIVPTYWAEARLQQPRSKTKKQITVRRFGWSNDSQVAAEQMAGQRVQEAFTRITSGETLLRREPKTPYSGADGVPIREEVLSRHGEVVITRNSYGAHCLNTPDVLFADIDHDFSLPGNTFGCLISLSVLISLGIGIALRSMAVGGGAIALIILIGICHSVMAKRWTAKALDEFPSRALTKIRSFSKAHGNWHMRIYRTPAGFRVLVLHQTFQPTDPAVTEFFTALGVDPVYATMCRNQQCFRARVSPKPWRMGMSRHMRPRPGVWPIKAEHVETRNSWVREYEAAATQFASCKFVEALGNGFTDTKAAHVRDLHDRMSQALSGREIA